MKKGIPSLFETLFFLSFISIVVSIFLAWTLVSGKLTDFFVNKAIEHNINISNSITIYIEDKLNEALNQLKFIDESITFNKSSNIDINNLIFQLNEIDKSFINIEILNFEGKVLYTLPQNSSETGFDRSRETYFSEFKNNQEVYWSNVQLSPYTGSHSITIVIHSEFGFVVGYLDLKEIQELSKVYVEEFGEHKDISITDRNGIFLVNKEISLVEERRLDPHHKLALEIINNSKYFLHNESEIESILITSTQIPSTQWIVNITELYRNAIGGIDFMIGIMASFVTIMLVVYTFLLWRGNAKIIQDLGTFSKRLINVSHGVEVDFNKGSFKELDSLNESFNVMIDKIADRDKKLYNLAYFDSLTNFHNRAYLDELILSLTRNHEKNYAVIYIDLDNFSHVNDTYGHHVGDQLLIEFSKQLKSILDDTIEIVRLGGDEFILVIRGENNIDEAVSNIVLKILDLSNEPMQCNDRLIYFTLSAGVSFYPTDGHDFWIILKNADIAMYQAKAAGKNTSYYFTKDMNVSIERRLLVEQQLRTAINNGEFRLEYQPQLSIDRKSIRGFEALVRWDNPILGSVCPLDFIAVTEENKMIVPLGNWIMRNACEDIKRLNDRFSSQFIIAVNVSPVEIREASFVENVIKIIKDSEIHPYWLEIEITENISIEKFSTLKETLEKLHEYGISISIDDFGTGYSSLAYLQNIPLDILKVDQSFINHLGEENDRDLMVETIFLMARNLGLMTIAEGVETLQQINFLKNLKCDYVQGYLMSKPLRMNSLFEFIENHKNINKL